MFLIITFVSLEVTCMLFVQTFVVISIFPSIWYNFHHISRRKHERA
jgi:hypothetical protein